MSSDYLDDVEDDEGTIILLTMKANGFAEFTIIEEERVASLKLLPDEIGWKNAEKIADALNSWIKYTKGEG